MNSQKPIVQYTQVEGEVVVGRSAFLVPINHPRLGGGRTVMTSQVLSHERGTGRIETLNTVYVPRTS